MHDGEAGLLDNIGSVLGVRHETLAVRKFSKCGRPDQVYAYQHIDTDSIMGAVGKAKRSEGLDPAALGRTLSVERDRAVEKTPGAGGALLALLDRDGDGSVLDEAGDLLKGFLGRK